MLLQEGGEEGYFLLFQVGCETDGSFGEFTQIRYPFHRERVIGYVMIRL